MYTTGTATGHNDLLDQLVDWLVNTVGWTEMDYSGVPSPDSDTEVRTAVLRAPGATSGNEFFLYLASKANVGSGFYGIQMNGAVDYDDSLSTSGQTLISPNVWLNLWNNSMDYWFIANDRRVIVIAKVNTAYMSAYAGLFLPFALPTEYKKPFLIGASYSALEAPDLSNSANRFIADPGLNGMYYLNLATNAWIAVANHEDTPNSNYDIDVVNTATMWPHKSLINGTVSATATGSWSLFGLAGMRPLKTGESPQYPCHIISYTELKMVGVLDGVFALPGFNRTSEQELSYGSPARTFLVVQNIFRTTGRDFMSVELD